MVTFCARGYTTSGICTELDTFISAVLVLLDEGRNNTSFSGDWNTKLVGEAGSEGDGDGECVSSEDSGLSSLPLLRLRVEELIVEGLDLMKSFCLTRSAIS